MKKISFLLSLFLLVGCKTPEIHIPSYNLGGDSNTSNNVASEEATSDVAAIEDSTDEEVVEEDNSPEVPTIKDTTPETETTKEDEVPTLNAESPSSEPTPEAKETAPTPVADLMANEEDDESDFDTNKEEPKVKKLQDTPKKETAKIETKGGFFSLFGKKPKVRNEYFTGGKLRSKFVMSDETGESGLLYKYGYDGKVTSTVYMKHGLKNGLETLFDEKGRVMKRTPFVNGRKDGIVEVYYPDGKVLAQITYANNKRHGRASKYNHDGTTNEEVQYIHGKVDKSATNSDDIEIPIID